LKGSIIAAGPLCLVAQQSGDHGQRGDSHRHPGRTAAGGGAVRRLGVQTGLSFRPDHPARWLAGGYRSTIDRLFAEVPAASIAWISMGALRYLPSLKRIAAERFPASRFFYQEFIDGLDGKCRYFRTQREAMYRFIYDEPA
jgi:hypothetical protein